MESIIIKKHAACKNKKQQYSPEFDELLKDSISGDEFWSLATNHIKELYAKQCSEHANNKI
jgi:hypothetical protein